MPPTIQPASTRIQVLEVIGNAIVGGMENSVLRLIERLPAQRFGVSALCPFESPYTELLRSAGAEVSILPMPDDPPWSGIHFACSLIKAGAIDVIHSHLPNAHVLAGIAGRLTGKPVLATIHGRQLSPLDLEVHRSTNTHLHVVCRQSHLNALGIGIAPAQLNLIPHGVDTEVFKPQRRRAGRLRQRFGIPEAACVVGFVGRLSPEKGPDVFLRMALGVHERSPQTRFIVIGDGPMRQRLENFVQQFDLAQTVHLAGMQDDIATLMNELDVIVSTSHSEAMPLTVMEAMASGLPMVATRVGAVPDLVQHGVTGWLAGEGDYEGLGALVLDLLQNDELRARAGLAARQRAVERFSLASTVHATEQLLTRLAQPRAEQRRIGTVTSNGKLVNGGLASTGKPALA
jgi:glycosyltransferase involved in cell wall biosynthesis